MSLFKTQMFTEDAVFSVPDFDREAEAYGPSYGNRVASERRFREYRPACRHEPAPSVETPCSECSAGA